MEVESRVYLVARVPLVLLLSILLLVADILERVALLPLPRRLVRRGLRAWIARGTARAAGVVVAVAWKPASWKEDEERLAEAIETRGHARGAARGKCPSEDAPRPGDVVLANATGAPWVDVLSLEALCSPDYCFDSGDGKVATTSSVVVAMAAAWFGWEAGGALFPTELGDAAFEAESTSKSPVALFATSFLANNSNNTGTTIAPAAKMCRAASNLLGSAASTKPRILLAGLSSAGRGSTLFSPAALPGETPMQNVARIMRQDLVFANVAAMGPATRTQVLGEDDAADPSCNRLLLAKLAKFASPDNNIDEHEKAE